MFLITVEDQQVVRLLEEKQLKLSQAGLAMFLVGRAAYWLQQRAKDRFENEGDDAVPEWQDLSEYTYNVREEQGYVPIKINTRTGALKSWVTKANGNVLSTDPISQLSWPGDAPTAGRSSIGKKIATAQAGARFPLTPARPILAVNETDLAAVMGFLTAYIMEPGAVPVAVAA